MAVDACTLNGISVPALSKSFQDGLRKNLTQSIAQIALLSNPLDLTGSAIDEDFVACTNALFTMEEIDCVLALLLPYVPGITLDIGSKLSNVASHFGKPLVAYVPHVDKYDMLIEGFELNGVPVSPSIDGSVQMVKAMRRNRA